MSFEQLVFEDFIAISSVMLRRELFTGIGGFDPRYSLAEDYDFLLKAVKKAPVDYIDDAIAVIPGAWRERHSYKDRPDHPRIIFGSSFLESKGPVVLQETFFPLCHVLVEI